MKKVMVFGTFDILHPGHINFFKQAKKFGDFLIVVIARDSTIAKVKKEKPINSQYKRMSLVKDSGLAEKVVLGGVVDKYAIIAKEKPDVIALGYDQSSFTKNLKKLINYKTNIVRLDSYKPEKFKSSKLKQSKYAKNIDCNNKYRQIQGNSY
ncbi:MAG: adenylyltransferase/cytidyltransferase family protein [bacterium]